MLCSHIGLPHCGASASPVWSLSPLVITRRLSRSSNAGISSCSHNDYAPAPVCVSPFCYPVVDAMSLSGVMWAHYVSVPCIHSHTANQRRSHSLQSLNTTVATIRLSDSVVLCLVFVIEVNKYLKTIRGLKLVCMSIDFNILCSTCHNVGPQAIHADGNLVQPIAR